MLPHLLQLFGWRAGGTQDVTVAGTAFSMEWSLETSTVKAAGAVGDYRILPSMDPVIQQREVEHLNKILEDVRTRLEILES